MNNYKIPKIIHYCWFGKKDKPELIKRCIKSWKDILNDYEVMEWNEDTFDISSNKFVEQAYDAGKFAFVSDYVRVYVLYNYGGIYMDTDVEVYKVFNNDILKNESFWGFEEKNFIATSTIGAQKGNKLIKELLDWYKDKSFIKDNGDIDMTTNVFIVSNIIKKLGIRLDGSYQELKGLATFYPQEYFSPYDYINCYSKENENTYTIHHFHKSWVPFIDKVKGNIKLVLAKIIGGYRIAKIRELISKS